MQIMVFGVRLNTSSSDAAFHTKHCQDCEVGVNSMLMAVRRSAVNTEKPDVLWTVKLPTPTSQVRGQVVGVGDKLVAYITDDSGDGLVAAFK